LPRRSPRSAFSGPACAVLALLCASPARAAVNYAFVASTGNDSGNASCARATPCLSLNTALNTVNAGGEVIIIGDGYQDFTVAIAKPVTIRAEKVALITGGIAIAAGANDHVTLQNLHIRNSTSAYTHILPAISIQSALEVMILNCDIVDTAYTINFVSTGYAAVDISANSAVRVTLNHVNVYNNTIGISVGGTPGTGHLKLFNSMLLGNQLVGLRVIGAGNDAMVSNTQILGSAKAIDLQSGGTVRSYGNNVITNGDGVITLPLN